MYAYRVKNKYGNYKGQKWTEFNLILRPEKVKEALEKGTNEEYLMAREFSELRN